MRLYPVTVKRTTIVQGGSGPNPTDALSVRFVFPDTNTAPTDATVFAFAFPDSVGAQADTVKVGVRSDDTNAAQTDTAALFRIAGLGDSVSTATDNVSVGVGFSDTNAAQVEALSLRVTLSDSSIAPTDNLGLLRVTSSDTSPTQSDAFTASMSFTATDSNALPTETVLLRGTFGADANAAPTDARSGTITWVGGSTAATSSGANGWTTPANAQGDTADATVASFSDASAIATAAGILTLASYSDPDATNSSWTITKVEIVEYASYTAGVKTLGADGWVLEGRISTGAYSIIQTTRVSFSNLTTPVVFDITSARPGGGSWTWTDITNWNMRLTYDSQLTETSSGSADTIVIRVTATKNPI